MADFAIHARGPWPSSAVSTRYVPSSFAPPPEVLQLIESAWTWALAQRGVRLFDGPLLRLEGFEASPERLSLSVSHTSYKPFLGTNGLQARAASAHGPQALANALGTSSLVLTGDGRLVFGVRSHEVALYPGCIHPFGGCLEPTELVDPAAQTCRELGEELGLRPGEIRAMRLLALGEDRQLLQPELVYCCEVSLSEQQLAGRLDHEHVRLWSIPDAEPAISQGLEAAQQRTPLTRLALMAYGGWRLGESWLRSRSPG